MKPALKPMSPREPFPIPAAREADESNEVESDRNRIERLEGFMKETRDLLQVMNDNIETLLIAAKENPVKARRSIDRTSRFVAPALPRVDSLRTKKSAEINLKSLVKWSHAAVTIQKIARSYLRRRKLKTNTSGQSGARNSSSEEPGEVHEEGSGRTTPRNGESSDGELARADGVTAAETEAQRPKNSGLLKPIPSRPNPPIRQTSLANLFGSLDGPSGPGLPARRRSSMASENSPAPTLTHGTHVSVLDLSTAAAINSARAPTFVERGRQFLRGLVRRPSAVLPSEPESPTSPKNPQPPWDKKVKPPPLTAGAPFFKVQTEGYEEAVKVKAKQMSNQYRVVTSEPHYMFNPKKRFKMTWDLILVMPLLVCLAVMVPFRLCFDNEPVLYSATYWFEFTIDLVFIFDIMLSFRTGYFLDMIDTELVEYNPWLVAINYLKGWFVFDCVSGIPFALIELVFASNTSNASALKSIKTLRIIRFLKLGRLLKLEKIMSNLDRDVVDRIEDFFSNIQTRSVIVVMVLALKMGYTVHLLSCLWVLVGRVGSLADDDNWLIHEMKGAFDASDTTGGRHVRSIYIAAFYYTLTTMTSVGYGDIITRNNTERAFTIFLEFVGSFVYAMITAALTSVVTTMDLNARKTAEQLDAVSSFVLTRKFPEDLGRRIRRHFRHFYSMKSAIDESKIFNELSTSLRKEVSTYLVSELMGDVELFRNMSAMLLPRLLPLLRPMRFETEEIVCEQGEECSEMYVVISGTLHGMTQLKRGDQDDHDEELLETFPRIRRINAGDTVNILTILGIWNRCLESVWADVPVESYAMTEKDFEGLFTAEADALAFEEMQEREIHHYMFDEYDFEGTPTKWGRPLYFCCFTAIDVTLVRGQNISAESSEPFAEIEVVDAFTGAPLSRLWHFRTSTASKGGKPFWNQGVEWQDILAPFSRLALRVSLYDSDFIGTDTCLGMCEIPFHELSALAPISEGRQTPSPALEDELKDSNRPIGNRSFDGFMPDSLQRFRASKRVNTTDGNLRSSRSVITSDEMIDPLKLGFAERWWKLKQSPTAGSNAAVSAGTRLLRRANSTLPLSTGSIQLRTHVRLPDRDPLPPPSARL